MKRKQYNFLDQRKTDFDQDYEEFLKQTNDLHVSFIFANFMLSFSIANCKHTFGIDASVKTVFMAACI